MATGPRGLYVASYSPSFHCDGATDFSLGGGQHCASNALRVLVETLIADGWQPIPAGRLWFNLRFEREAR
jgi:hypothetical protein